jgi:23S rRNA U2552 (ribose-2'-O)-methylase RlmE/FtsJ
MEPTTEKPPWVGLVFQVPPLVLVQQNIEWIPTWMEKEHDDLNILKQKITPYEENHTWEKVKKLSNPYELVYTNEAPFFPPSLALQKPLSRSYFKMIEMMEISQFFERLPKTANTVRSAHVAEGPGGFIEAFLDRAEMNRKKVAKSTAMTLKPNGSNIPGWRRAHTFLQKHSEITIHYGRDGTGDIYKTANQQSFIEICNPKANIFTADGGFDFSQDYSTQEKDVYPLLISSALTGLQCLQPGGLFIMKLFDIFGEPTQFLIRMISYCFKDWLLYKPATSRPCNSERYFICRGFKRCIPEVIQILVSMETNIRDHATYPKVTEIQWTAEEKLYLDSHLKLFTENQVKIIIDSFKYIDNNLSVFSWNKHIHNAQHWCNTFRIPTHLQSIMKIYKEFGYVHS